MHVGITDSTVPLLVLALCVLYLTGGRLLPVGMFMSVFQAASSLDVGAGGAKLGITPGVIFVALALAGYLFGKRRRPTAVVRSRSTLLLTVFVAYAALTAFVSPLLFAGVPITNPRIGTDVPLAWGTSHLPQLCYLALGFCVYLYAAYKAEPDELSKAVDWYVSGVVLAALGALYQAAALRFGLPFPEEILYTNHYVIYDAYKINGFVRVNSTFSEASAAAFCFTSALAICMWRMLSGDISLRTLLSGSLIFIGLILTLSTTGYSCLLFLVTVATWHFLSNWRGSARFRAFKIALVIPTFCFGALLAMKSDFRESFDRLAHTVILDKADTASYRERARINEGGMETAENTDWLGAGWGIYRASSFLPTLAANTGVPGVLLLSSFFASLFAPIWKSRRRLAAQHATVLFALGGIVVTLIISGPDLAQPIIWLLCAMAARMAVGYPGRIKRGPRAAATLQNSFDGSLHPVAG